MFKVDFKSEEYPQEENRRIDQSKRNAKEQKKKQNTTHTMNSLVRSTIGIRMIVLKINYTKFAAVN